MHRRCCIYRKSKCHMWRLREGFHSRNWKNNTIFGHRRQLTGLWRKRQKFSRVNKMVFSNLWICGKDLDRISRYQDLAQRYPIFRQSFLRACELEASDIPLSTCLALNIIWQSDLENRDQLWDD